MKLIDPCSGILAPDCRADFWRDLKTLNRKALANWYRYHRPKIVREVT